MSQDSILEWDSDSRYIFWTKIHAPPHKVEIPLQPYLYLRKNLQPEKFELWRLLVPQTSLKNVTKISLNHTNL